MTSQKRALSHAISLAVKYRLFSHGDVSYTFNGKNDNVVLESVVKYDLISILVNINENVLKRKFAK